MPDPLILAIDLGTSGVKAALVDDAGRLLATGLAPIQTLRVSGRGAEQDPAAVLEAIAAASRQAVGSAPARRGDVIGVAVCSQFSSIIAVDARARPLMNMVLWMDQRGAPEALRALPGGPALVTGPLGMLRFIRYHGVPPLGSGNDSLAHMRWIKLARPEVYARTAAFLEPADFVTAWMTGRVATNPCTAFMMLVVDNRRPRAPRYHPALVRASGIDPDKLPELLEIGADVGTLRADAAERLGLPAGARVFSPCNDTQAGGAASFAIARSSTHAGISIGTSSVLVTHAPRKRTSVRDSLATMPSPIAGEYTIIAENGVGGRAVETLLDRFVFADDGFGDHRAPERYAALARALANTRPGAGGLLFLPWLSGSVSPAEDGRVRGGFLNMSLETTREQLARATLEGVAFNLRWLLRPVERFLGRRLTHLVFFGGGALLDPWAQIIADILELPVHRVESPRFALCRGVALLGFYRAGLAAPEDFEARVPIASVAEPRAALAEPYRRVFTQFERAFRRNRSIFHALNSPGGPSAR